MIIFEGKLPNGLPARVVLRTGEDIGNFIDVEYWDNRWQSCIMGEYRYSYMIEAALIDQLKMAGLLEKFNHEQARNNLLS